MLDITNTPDGDVELGTGDLTCTESTGQHKRDLLLSDKGHYKESPAVGVGAMNYMHDTNPENFYRAILKECAADGMKVRDVKMKNNTLEIDAEYENRNR